ncbi:hypothetical protein CO660_00095 [Rhizobium sp. L9]|uniref:COG3904 family protein n=1 Tax=Rhizobium sp. L9 TaxID=1340738 RepID=UPI000BE823FA|nr:hypothetical protein [Rhizobium sp. L9]PDT32279.1 hypothetical protein CO660_00095 [Rhizobium sp. L9]
MPIHFSFRPTFCLIAAVLFLSMIAAVPADANQQPPEERPMDFVLVHDANCKETCTQWISAEGAITSDTPRRFKALLKTLKDRKLPVVFQSYGGDVVAALSIGRMIRAAGLETAVGRTKLSDCPMLEPRCSQKIVKNSWSVGEVHGGGAYCFSACPLLIAGGKVRAAAETSDIGLHQITNGRKGASYGTAGRRNLDAISTKSDPALKRMLSAYLDEMGVSRDDVFAMMGLATPDGLYRVQTAEALRSGLITKVFSDTEEPGYAIHAADPQASEGVVE